MTKRSRALPAGLVAASAALSLSSCAAASSVTIEVDYPAYETPASLAREAVVVVEATAVGKEPTVLLPRFEGDTAEENPYLGVSADERQRAVDEDDGVPGEAVTLKVDVVYRGDLSEGDDVVFIQTGGILDGLTYEIEDESDLQVGVTYLLFGAESVNGAFTVLGGSAGAFTADDDRYLAISDAAPVRELTVAEVKALE